MVGASGLPGRSPDGLGAQRECWGPQRPRRGEPREALEKDTGSGGHRRGGLEQLRGEEGEREGGRNPPGNQERKRGVRPSSLASDRGKRSSSLRGSALAATPLPPEGPKSAEGELPTRALPLGLRPPPLVAPPLSPHPPIIGWIRPPGGSSPSPTTSHRGAALSLQAPPTELWREGGLRSPCV